MHCAVAPAGLLLTLERDACEEALAPVAAEGVGLGAGATVVRAGAVEVAVLQTARILLIIFVQSIVFAAEVVVVFTAPAVFPVDV